MSTILKNRDNYVSIQFTGVNLTDFDSITAVFGSDSRDTLSNPGSVVVHSDSELRLFFGDTTETGGHYWEITGYDLQNPNGYQLTGKCIGNLDKTGTC